MAEWFSVEVMDARFSARSWADSHGDALIYSAQLKGVIDWHWHEHPWGLVLELQFRDELAWEQFCDAPATRAALDVVPDPVAGLLLYRGRGGSAGTRHPRRPRPLAGAGAAALPIPEDPLFDTLEPARTATLVR